MFLSIGGAFEPSPGGCRERRSMGWILYPFEYNPLPSSDILMLGPALSVDSIFESSCCDCLMYNIFRVVFAEKSSSW